MSSSLKPFHPPSTLKGLFVGSGSDGMNEEQICKAVVDLIDKNKKGDTTSTSTAERNILYLGTATYDLAPFRERQTSQFAKVKGCQIHSLDVATTTLPKQKMQDLIQAADAIIVSGGNTLYALDRWKLLGMDDLLKQAMNRGAVLTGGSAGAICWFDGGHSDSMDPDTWKDAMLAKFPPQKNQEEKEGKDESSEAPKSMEDAKDWQYIRVPGLGFLPGLVCPHHDKIQSNGVLRATDFDAMLQRHSSELGIGIDHWAALQVDGDSFQVVSLEDKEGSILPNGEFSPTRQGKPGIWIKTVNAETGQVESKLCPPSGKLSDLLRHSSEIISDARVEACRKSNPAS